MDIITLITTVGGLCGAIATVIALIALIIKPIRSKLIGWVGRTADTANINTKIDNLTVLVEKSIEQNDKLQEDMDKQSNALQASLRNSILNLYYKCMAKRSITTFELQNLTELYDNYKALKGNSFISRCVQILSEELEVKDD